LFFIGDRESLKLPYDSSSLQLIRRIRDEVHRFGINFHRTKRSSGTFKNELEDIKGIGESTATLLLKTFRSVNAIRNQPFEEIAKIIGPAKATIVRNYFQDAGEKKQGAG
jgi:excinuclease ABC subunit C